MVVAIPELWGGAVSRSELRRPFWTPPSNGVNDATYMSNPSNSIVLDNPAAVDQSAREGPRPDQDWISVTGNQTQCRCVETQTELEGARGGRTHCRRRAKQALYHSVR